MSNMPNAESFEQILVRLLQRKLWLAVAESCTGGLVGHRITNVAGSSEYFRGGVIAYDNAVKENVLGVPGALLVKYGAVSSEVALEMARGARRVLHADIGLSTTGIAGPGGATPTKPVGLAYVAIVTPDWERVERCLASGDRLTNKAAFADTALKLVVDYALRG
jgi:PncC family amidohydrolase